MDKSTVKFTPGEVVKAVEDGFRDIFKPFHKYQTQQHELWNRCIGTISDHSKLDKIVFANDLLKIPPAKVFLAFNPDLSDSLSTPLDKMFMGSFSSYVFGSVFGYKNRKQVATGLPSLKTALYFFDNAANIVIAPSDAENTPPETAAHIPPAASPTNQEKKARKTHENH